MKKKNFGFTLAEVKPSRGRHEVPVESASTETLSFRCKDERCRLMRGAVRRGFTLAEVLIVIGVIGVVAAMTIPTLIANNQSQKFRSQYKKTLSTLNQAVKMNVAQYDFDFAGVEDSGNTNLYSINGKKATRDNCHTQTYENGFKTFCSIFNSNLTGYTVGIREPVNFYEKYYQVNLADKFIESENYYILSDGSIFIMPGLVGDIGQCSLRYTNLRDAILEDDYEGPKGDYYFTDCIGYIDVNGFNSPNKEVKCSDGTTSRDLNEPCVVDNKSIGDVFPIILYDSTVAPASNAAQYVLNTTK